MDVSFIWKRFPVWFFLAVLLPQSSLAQEINCNNSGLTAVQNTLGYKIRKGSTRCEGLYSSPVGSSLDIVSFRHGNSPLSSKQNLLDISAPPLKQLAVKNINIRAEAIPLDTFYRMDAVLTESKPLTWPLNAVVIPAGISPDDLGIFGWIKKDTGKVFVPVDVYPKGLASYAKTGNKPLTIVIRPAVNVDKILWRTVDLNKQERLDWNEVNNNQENFITFTIPDGPTGIIGLELVAHIHNTSGWEDIQKFRLYRVGQ